VTTISVHILFNVFGINILHCRFAHKLTLQMQTNIFALMFPSWNNYSVIYNWFCISLRRKHSFSHWVYVEYLSRNQQNNSTKQNPF
jgi:hypothetical protein